MLRRSEKDMLLSIGRAPKPKRDLVDALLACHERIRRFVALASVVGSRPELAPNEARDACEQVERYFRQAFPLHVRDEDDSLLPRLEGRHAELDRALEEMHAEHDAHEASLERMLAACEGVCGDPADAGRRKALGEAAARMSALFEPHLQREERVIFPATRELLAPSDLALVLDEFRARRAQP